MEATVGYGRVAISHPVATKSRSPRKFNSYSWLQVAGIMAAIALGAAALAWATFVIMLFGGMALGLFEFVGGTLIV